MQARQPENSPDNQLRTVRGPLHGHPVYDDAIPVIASIGHFEVVIRSCCLLSVVCHLATPTVRLATWDITGNWVQ